MKHLNKLKGTIGETEACEFLQKRGYLIIEKNFRCRTGEIDIVARDGKYIAFIEVKSRCNNNFGRPCEAVTGIKVHKLLQCSQFYILKNKLKNCLFRFDVIEVMLDMDLHCEEINLIQNAFSI